MTRIRKPKVFTHAVLIFLTAVILFPIVWVVMTSLRRDNAAFSPKLFSSNLTLQHYKDLLLPPRNVPVLISDLSNAITLSKPFDGMKREDVEKAILKDISDLKRYVEKLKKTENFLAKETSRIEKELEGRIDDILEELDLRANEFVSSLPEGKMDGEAVLYVQKILGRKFPAEVSEEEEEDFKRDYMGPKDELEEIEEKLKGIEERLRAIDSRVQGVSSEVFEGVQSIRGFSSDLKRMLKVLRGAFRDGGLRVDTEKVENLVGELLAIVPNVEDLNELKGLLSDISEVLKDLKVDRDLEGAVEDVLNELGSMLKDLRVQLETLREEMEELENLEKEKEKLLGEKADLEGRAKGLREKIEAFVEERREGIRTAYSEYLRWKIGGILGFEEALREWRENLPDLAKAFGKKVFVEVKKCQRKVKRNPDLKESCIERIWKMVGKVGIVEELSRTLRKEIPLMEELGIDVKVAREIAEKASWAESYSSFLEASRELQKAMGDLAGGVERELESLEGKWKSILEIAEGGIKVIPSEITRMNELVSSVYGGRVSGKLGIAMREARNLSEVFPVTHLRKDFKEIDARLYSIQQDWKRKPKHYFLRWVMNSIVVSGVVALITTAVTALAAYPFSRMRFFGRKYGIMMLLLIQMFPAIMYMVALYGMLAFLGKIVPWLGLDTLGGLIFVYLGGIAFNMFLIKGFYDTIPSSLEESAMIDGATRLQTFFLIILPLAKPILAVVVILTFMGTFNEFVLARIILQDVKNYTYALGLWQFTVGPFETEWGLFTAAALLGMIPMVVLFLSMQKFLISGLTKGAVKG